MKDKLDFYDFVGIVWLIGSTIVCILNFIGVINQTRVLIGVIGISIIVLATTVYVFEAEKRDES